MTTPNKDEYIYDNLKKACSMNNEHRYKKFAV